VKAAFYIETERLILRSFNQADTIPFYQYRSDPEVARYQGWEIPYSLEMAERLVAVMLLMPAHEPGQFYQVAIELRSTGEMIGDCAYKISAMDHLQAEIGFTLAKRFQGKGYATEAVGRLVDYLFNDLKIHRIIADVDPANNASAKLLARLGFRHEGLFKESWFLRGEWVDEDWYAILRREWLSRRTLG